LDTQSGFGRIKANVKRSKPGRTWRTAVVSLRLSGADYRRAHEACHRAGLYWTALVDGVHRHWETNHSDPTSQETLHMVADPELLRLHAHTKQKLVDQFFENLATYRTNLKQSMEACAPWREKRYMPLTFTAGYGWRITPDGRLGMSLGRADGRIIVRLPEVADLATGQPIPPEVWGTIKLCWDRQARRWALHIAVPTDPPPELDPSNVLAIDEGIINPMTLATETEDAYQVTVINGRHARAVKRRRNKAVAGLQRAKSRTIKRSRKWRQLDRAERRAKATAAKALRNMDHQVSRQAATMAQQYDTGKIVVGDVAGIEQNTKRKRSAGRDQRRRLSQWSRGRQEQYLTQKTGVKLLKVSESYTSKTCPVCLAHNRPSGRNYQCSTCGFACHRDAVGAINILMIAKHGVLTPIDPDKPIRVNYLRATPLKVSARSKAQNRATSRHQMGRVADLLPASSHPMQVAA